MRVRSFLAAWIRFKRGDISLYDLKLWLASFEVVARRCQVKGDRLPTYTEEELVTLLGNGTKSKAKKGIQRLVAAGLMQWDRNCISTDTLRAEAALADSEDYIDTVDLIKNRKVPVPRRILRHIIQTRNSTLIGTVFGHLFRCLYYRRDKCVSGGRCKASFVSEALQLDLRNVKASRKQLIRLGWIVPCDANQTSLNRWGLPVVINLHWEYSEKRKDVKSPPPVEHSGSQPPPLCIYKQPLTGSNNQKLETASGVQNRTRSEKKESLKNITLEDLRKPERLERLFRWAVAAGSVLFSESSRLAWFSAAEHALQVGKQNPCGLFVALYRRRLWHHINQEQEDRARVKLKMLDFGQDSRLPGEIREFITDHRRLAA